MRPSGRLRDFIPTLLAVILVASFLALLFEFIIDSARATPLDPVATPVLGTIVATCIPALAAFWALESKPSKSDGPGPDPPGGRPARTTWVEKTGDEESDQWNRDHGYLELRRWGRWKPCSSN
jgi:hypothetical protein